MTTHTSETILLSLGSNIEPKEFLPAAVRLLASRVEILAASRVFETVSVGEGQGTMFLNAALQVRSELEPADLKFGVLRRVEAILGRARSSDRNAPRTIDVDISLFGQRILSDPEMQLEIPDPEIVSQAHVAIPLADVAPATVHPLTRDTLAAIAARLVAQGVRVLPELVLWPRSDRF